VTVITGLQVPEQHIRCTQQLHTSQGRLCTTVESYDAKSVLVKTALVSIPSTVDTPSFLPKISQHLPFSILHKSIPSNVLFYFCTCLYVSAHALVNSLLAQYHQQSPTGVTTVLQLRSIGLYPDVTILTHTCGGRAMHDPSDHPGMPSAHDYYMQVDAALTVALSQGLET